MGTNSSGVQFNAKAVLDRMFRKADGVVWDLMSGKVGIQGPDGVATLGTELKEAQVQGNDNVTLYHISINPFDSFVLPIPAFAQNTPFADVKPGDIVHGARDILGWVVEKKERSFDILKRDGTKTNWSSPKVEMMGIADGTMVVRPLLDIAGGQADGLKSFQNSLLPMMMLAENSGGDSSEMLTKIMPLMMMQQASGGKDGMAGMMPFLMMGMLGKGFR